MTHSRMTADGPSDVIAAQQAFAEDLDGLNPRDEAGYDPGDHDPQRAKPAATGAQAVPGEHVESQMPDGSIFSLTVR
jgi:hypothetical protein